MLCILFSLIDVFFLFLYCSINTINQHKNNEEFRGIMVENLDDNQNKPLNNLTFVKSVAVNSGETKDILDENV